MKTNVSWHKCMLLIIPALAVMLGPENAHAGSLVGWGDDYFDQATPPAGMDFVAIAAGDYHGLALKADGSITVWGAGEPGQTGWPHYGQATPLAGTDFAAFTAGGSHNLALKVDGSIIGWGRDDEGQATSLSSLIGEISD